MESPLLHSGGNWEGDRRTWVSRHVGSLVKLLGILNIRDLEYHWISGEGFAVVQAIRYHDSDLNFWTQSELLRYSLLLIILHRLAIWTNPDHGSMGRNFKKCYSLLAGLWKEHSINLSLEWRKSVSLFLTPSPNLIISNHYLCTTEQDLP